MSAFRDPVAVSSACHSKEWCCIWDGFAIPIEIQQLMVKLKEVERCEIEQI